MKDNIYWLKADIDSKGERWHLIQQTGTILEFLGEEFMDFEDNYKDCLRSRVVPPESDDFVQDVLRSVTNYKQWLGNVHCSKCNHKWVAVTAWGVEEFECPQCHEMTGRKILSRGKEMVERIITALVDVGGLTANQAIDWLKKSLEIDLGATLSREVRDDALRALREIDIPGEDNS